MSCFFKTLSGNLLTLSSKTFPQIVKNLCTFLWKDRDVYFYKFEIRFFFSCIFFRLQSKFSRNPGLFFRAALTKQHWILSQEVFFGRRIFFIFFKFSLVFAILNGKRTDFWPNFFNRLSKRLWCFPEEKCEVSIFFHFWKKLGHFSFNLFGVWSMFFFSKTRQSFLESLVKAAFLSPRKIFSAKSFFWKKIVSFYLFSDIWAQKDRSKGHTFRAGTQNCCFPAQMNF